MQELELKNNLIMILEKDIEKILSKLDKLSEEEFITEYEKITSEQIDVFGFFVDTAKQFNLKKDSKNATAELLFNIFSLYKNKYPENYPIILAETIIDVIKEKEDTETELHKLLDIDQEAEESYAIISEIYNNVNEAVINSKIENLTEQEKIVFDYIVKRNSEITQKALIEYVINYIETDELIEDFDRPIVNMIIETTVQAFKKQMKETN